MRHILVRRTAGLLAAVFILCAMAFVRLVTPAQTTADAPRGNQPPGTTIAGAVRDTAPHPGAAPYERYCVQCHTVASLQPGVRAADSSARAELLRFLQGHGRAPDEDDRLIIEFLAEQP